MNGSKVGALVSKRTAIEALVGTIILAAFGGWIWIHAAPSPRRPPAQTSEPGLTLWLAGDQPRPGSIYRIWEANGLGRADPVSDLIADRFVPRPGKAADVSILLNDGRLLQAAATLAKGVNANVGAQISRSRSTTLITSGTDVLRIPTRTDFLVPLQAWDKAPKNDEKEANHFAELRHPLLPYGQPDPPEGARYVVTEVRTVRKFEFETSDQSKDHIGFNCQIGHANNTCGKFDVGRTIIQSDGRSAHEPLVAFVSLKRIGYKSGGIVYDARQEAPIVVAGN